MARRKKWEGFCYSRTIDNKEKNYYLLLGISPDEKNSAKINSAYKKAALRCHPDKNPKADPAEFPLLKQAYETIKNPQLRERYDARATEINTSFDPTTTPDAASLRLKQFFTLLFHKRGLGRNWHSFKVHQRENTRDEFGNAFGQTAARLFNDPTPSESVTAWHYLELNIIDEPNTHKAISTSASILNKLLSQGRTNTPDYVIEEQYGFKFVFRQANYSDQAKTAKPVFDIFLHDINKLEVMISQLEDENPIPLLQDSITQKLQDNPDNRTAKAAQKILTHMESLPEQSPLLPQIGFNLNCALNHPTDRNLYDIEQLVHSIKKNETVFWENTSSFWMECLESLKMETIRDALEKDSYFKFKAAIREVLKKHPQDPRALTAEVFLHNWHEVTQAGLGPNEIGISLDTVYKVFINPSQENLDALQEEFASIVSYYWIFTSLTLFITLSCITAITAGIICNLPWLIGTGLGILAFTLLIYCLVPYGEEGIYLKKEKLFDNSAHAFFKAAQTESIQLPENKDPLDPFSESDEILELGLNH